MSQEDKKQNADNDFRLGSAWQDVLTRRRSYRNRIKNMYVLRFDDAGDAQLDRYNVDFHRDDSRRPEAAE